VPGWPGSRARCGGGPTRRGGGSCTSNGEPPAGRPGPGHAAAAKLIQADAGEDVTPRPFALPSGEKPVSGVGQLVTSGPLILAVPVAAAAGAITFASPWLPAAGAGYLAYVTGMSGDGARGCRGAPRESARGRSRAVAGTALFVAGFSALFASHGAAFAGRRDAAAHQKIPVQVSAV